MVDGFNPEIAARIVVFVPLMRAKGFPLISFVPVASAGSVPQTKEFLVLLPPALTTDLS